MSTLRRLSPFAAIVGYLALYYNGPKGLSQIVPDLQSITIAKLTEKWQNFAIAAACIVVVHILPKLRLPTAIKTLIVVVLYFIAGWQIATAIDPPSFGDSNVSITQPRTYNPYADAIRGG
jgi:hypothetical protein